MYDLFPEYYEPSDEAYTELWENCIFVLDTNALLDLYRYSRESREDMFKLLENERIVARLWFSYHVEYEFEKNYKNILNYLKKDQESLAVGIKNALEAEIEKLEERSKGKLSREPLSSYTETLIEVLRESLEKLREAGWRYTEEDIEEEHQRITKRIRKLLSGSIGEPYSKERFEQLHREAQRRYSKKIPPGYKDVGKRFNPFGDFIIWDDALEQAKKKGKPLIFVTSDTKDDWLKDKRPRAELLREIINRTEKFGYVYNFESFYNFATEKYLKLEVNEATRAEIREFEERRRQRKARRVQSTVTKVGTRIDRAELAGAIASSSLDLDDDAIDRVMENIRTSEELSALWEEYKAYEKKLLDAENDYRRDIEIEERMLREEGSAPDFSGSYEEYLHYRKKFEPKKEECLRRMLEIASA